MTHPVQCVGCRLVGSGRVTVPYFDPACPVHGPALAATPDPEPTPESGHPADHLPDPVVRESIPATNAWCARCGYFPLPLHGARILTDEPTPDTEARLRDAISGERRNWHEVSVRPDDLAAVLDAGRRVLARRPAATPQADRGDDPDRNVWDYLDGPSVRSAAQRLVNAEDALADAHAAWPVHVGTYDQHLRVQHAAETEVVTAKASLRAALRDTAPSGPRCDYGCDACREFEALSDAEQDAALAPDASEGEPDAS